MQAHGGERKVMGCIQMPDAHGLHAVDAALAVKQHVGAGHVHGDFSRIGAAHADGQAGVIGAVGLKFLRVVSVLPWENGHTRFFNASKFRCI